jgi:hypothetical protein
MTRQGLTMLLAISAMMAIVIDLCNGPRPRDTDPAAARTRPIDNPDAEAAEDQQLTHDANEAGYRWAERQGLEQPHPCFSLSEAYREGCLAYVAEASAPAASR